MALCASCGNGEHLRQSDEAGMCGFCHQDSWVQWEDFFIRSGLTYGGLSKNYWLTLIEKTGVKNMIELMVLVLDSEAEHFSRGEGLTWVFQYNLGPGIREAIKNG
jgi:hypothetical protein